MTTRFLLEFCNVLSIEYLYGPFLLVIFSTLCIFCCDARSSFRIILQCNILRLCGGVAWILPTWSTECVPRWPWVIMIGDIFSELAVRFYLNCVIPNPTSCHQAHHDFFSCHADFRDSFVMYSCLLRLSCDESRVRDHHI